ncbi:MAG TPA: N-acetyltransferase [Thermoanaerobaculia bacterium]|nr:N-acetyltransferase [Thermoanaerobaculia bacterium]
MTAPSIERIGREKADLSRFFDVADRIYASDPHWVAPLRDDLAKVFRDENPFFRHGEIQLFVARRGGEDVGRIAAILDRNHNEFHGEKAAFFGYFEADDDPEIAKALLDAAALWGRERKMTVLRGPTNPTLNDEAGLLVDGFDSSPVLMMTYNPTYYSKLLEGQGFRKAKDLLAYWFPLEEKPLARLSRVADRFRKHATDIVVRNVTKKSLTKDLMKIREVYNEAWEKNWGFVPMTPEEMDFMAARMKPLLVPELLWLGEVRKPDGTLDPIAFMLMLPDFNTAMKPLKGRLLPFGWLKFLLGVKKIKTVRVLTLGIKLPYRQSGIQSIMMADSLRFLLSKGYTGAEVSWLLEDNELVIAAVRLWGGRLYKTYRIYEKAL